MSVTGGVILCGQCCSLKHTQQTRHIADTRPRLNDSWSGEPASALLSSSVLPPLISALIWFDPLAFFSLCCSCYCQVRWHNLSLKLLNCRLGGLTWKALTVACIISCSAWILTGPAQRTGERGRWRKIELQAVLVLQYDYVFSMTFYVWISHLRFIYKVHI